MKMSFVFLATILTASSAFAKIEKVLGDIKLEQNPNIISVPTTAASEIVLSRDQYILSYNKFNRSPNWAAWKLEKNNIGSSGRSDNFAQDTLLEDYLNDSNSQKHAVLPTEFRGSCFDRGHQVPSADRTDSAANNEVTFLMSNMIPQTAYLNRVVWEHLEQYTRDMVKTGKKAYIVAGPIYDEKLGSIGPDKDIPVPSKNFKVIVFINPDKSKETVAVVMPNIREDGTKPVVKEGEACKPFVPGTNDRRDWEKYKTNLAEVERLSGLKFNYSEVSN